MAIFAVVAAETFSRGDSFRGGHHELMPGCLMKVSGPKEHLSVNVCHIGVAPR